MTFCINPLTTTELVDLIGPNFVSNFQSEMDPILQPLRKHIAQGRPLSLGKELWEYAVADSIVGGTWNGAGHSFIDVRIGNNIGIDVKGVSKDTFSKSTTEASMFQNFNQTAKQCFENKDAEGVWNIHVKGWLSKISDIQEYYILGIIREKETLDCSLCGFKVSNIDLDYDQQLVKFNKTSIVLSGIADPNFINVRYYNSKSRLEIKFNKACWEDKNHCLAIYKF